MVRTWSSSVTGVAVEAALLVLAGCFVAELSGVYGPMTVQPKTVSQAIGVPGGPLLFSSSSNSPNTSSPRASQWSLACGNSYLPGGGSAGEEVFLQQRLLVVASRLLLGP